MSERIQQETKFLATNVPASSNGANQAQLKIAPGSAAPLIQNVPQGQILDNSYGGQKTGVQGAAGGSSLMRGSNLLAGQSNLNRSNIQDAASNQKIKLQIGKKKALNASNAFVNTNLSAGPNQNLPQSRNFDRTGPSGANSSFSYYNSALPVQNLYANSFNNLYNNQSGPLSSDQVSQGAQNHTSSFTHGLQGHQLNANVSNRVVKGAALNMIGAHQNPSAASQKMQFFINDASNHQQFNLTAANGGPQLNQPSGQAQSITQSNQKKTRRLRKNFDLLTQALKNASTSKREKKINFSSDSRAYNNTGQLAPQIYSQNYIANENNSPSLNVKQQLNQTGESIAQIYQYGANIQRVQPFKDRKSSAYDVLTGMGGANHNQSQSQRVPSHHSYNSGGTHNQSLFSQISIKDSSNQVGHSPPKNLIGTQNYSQARNASMMIYQNLPNNGLTNLNSAHAALQGGDQPKQFMRVNDKTMTKRVLINAANSGNSNGLSAQGSHQVIDGQSNQALQNLGIGSSGNGSQAILNINTASDINIYNNSFIVNTTAKKLSHSQGQSRSNSLKRNQQPLAALGQVTNVNAPSQRIINKQSSIQRIIYQTTYTQSNLIGNTGSQAAITQANGQHGSQNSDYLVLTNKYLKPQSSTGRVHSTGVRQGNYSQGMTSALQNLINPSSVVSGSGTQSTHKLNQIAEAYNTNQGGPSINGQPPFFSQTLGAMIGGGGHHQHQISHFSQVSQNSQQPNQLVGLLQGNNQKGSQSSGMTHNSSQNISQQQQQKMRQHQLQNISHNSKKSSKGLKKQSFHSNSSYHNNPIASSNHGQSFDLQLFNKSQDERSIKINNGQGGYLQPEGFHSLSTQNFPARNKFKFNSSSQVSKRQRSIRGDNNNQSHNYSAIGGGEDSYPRLDDPNFSPQINHNLNNEQSKKKLLSLNLTNQGKQKLLEKDYQGAIKLFSDAVSIDQTNLDAKFYRAVSHLDSGLTSEALIELQELLRVSPDHSQLTHILLSIAFKRQNDINESINILNQCIQKHPTYPDAFLARGQAFLLQEMFEEALKDFQQYTVLMPGQNAAIGFIGMGDSQKAMRMWNEAIQSFSRAVNIFSKVKTKDLPHQDKVNLMTTYLKRGLSFYYLKKYQQALSDLQVVTQFDSTQYKAHFYIGKILSRQYAVTPRIPSSQATAQKLQNDAILHFEQVVKHQLNEVYAGNALFEISKLRLKDKDFYEAYFNLKRAVDSNFNSKRLQLYKDFTEGVLYLIKRKIKKGVQILSDLLEVLVNNKEKKKDKRQMDYLKHQAYIYRAYGYVAIEKYEVALSDIKKAKKIARLDAASIYNKLLGKGILRMDHEDYLMATKYFNKASGKFSLNKDPYCLYIISIVRSYSYSMADYTVDNELKREKVVNAKIFMDSAIKNCNKIRIPSLFFFRGLLHFQLHMFYEALKDFNVAIEEEEEPTASYYLARGRVYACLSILTEAMKDLSIALNLDDTLQEAYIYRGKCAYLLGDNNLAFLDFQRLILTDPKNPMVHVYAGNLLMTTGAYQDAIKAFMNADTVQTTAVAAFQRARCYCALTDLENAKMQFKVALDLIKNEYLVKIDSQCLSALMKVIASQHHQNPQAKDKAINEAIDSLNQLLDLFQSSKIKELQKKDARLNIQIIPNVKRIKVEKVAVAKELAATQSDQKDLTISVDLTQTVDFDQLNDIPMYSYFYENVFQLEDFYLFRAVFNFYSKNYKASIKDYEYCRDQRHTEEGGAKHQDTKSPTAARNRGDVSPTNNQDHAESMQLYSRHSQSSTPISMASSKTDLSDVGLCSLNVHETNFNVLLCHLMTKDYTQALSRLSELITQAPKKYQKYFFLIRSLVYEVTDQLDKAIKDMKKLEQVEPKIYEQYFGENKDVFFEPFPIKNRLCSKFETVKICINPNRANAILTKPSFSMPFIKPPNMIPNIDEEVIQNEFTLKQIDAPMPEAPWIRRCENGGGIKFTDNILPDEDEEESKMGQSRKPFIKEEDQGYQLEEVKNRDKIMEIALSHDTQKEPTNNLKQKAAKNSHKEKTAKLNNAPSKGNVKTTNQSKLTDESPYVQSVSIPNDQRMHTIPSIGMPNEHSLGGIGERILQNATVYLMDGGIEDDQLSDKHKISLFDDSKFEDFGTLDNSNYTYNKTKKPNSKANQAARDKYYNNNTTNTNTNTGNNNKNTNGLAAPRGRRKGTDFNENPQPRILDLKNQLMKEDVIHYEIDDCEMQGGASIDQGEDELLNQDLLKAGSISEQEDDIKHQQKKKIDFSHKPSTKRHPEFQDEEEEEDNMAHEEDDEEEEDEDSSADEDDNGPDAIKTHGPAVFDRDSMVLVVESMTNPIPKKKVSQTKKAASGVRGSMMSDAQRAEAEAKINNQRKHKKPDGNAILIASEGGFEVEEGEDEDRQTEKQRILSKLNSDMNELDDEDEEEQNRHSIFRKSRPSSRK